ncbi:hypothetical protein HY638_05055 [Candidatus Woesearchaeota archaeon]|nr:hypothetical protein [Candidatus Woesearchaeota archaeon]
MAETIDRKLVYSRSRTPHHEMDYIFTVYKEPVKNGPTSIERESQRFADAVGRLSREGELTLEYRIDVFSYVKMGEIVLGEVKERTVKVNSYMSKMDEDGNAETRKFKGDISSLSQLYGDILEEKEKMLLPGKNHTSFGPTFEEEARKAKYITVDSHSIHISVMAVYAQPRSYTSGEIEAIDPSELDEGKHGSIIAKVDLRNIVEGAVPGEEGDKKAAASGDDESVEQGTPVEGVPKDDSELSKAIFRTLYGN